MSEPASSASLDASADVGALYGEHHDWLHGWLRRRLGNAADAADLAHDTFLRLLGRRDLAAVRTPRAFLTTIAHGVLVNHWRRRAIEDAYLDTLAALSPASAPSPERRMLLLDALYALDALLAALNPKARSAFLMAQLDGLTYGEIADRLAVSERMVKKYMAQAMLHCLASGLHDELPGA